MNNLICFQDLWLVITGRSCMKDPELVTKDLNNSIDALKLGLGYYQPYSESSVSKFKKETKISENLNKFVLKAAKLLNLDCHQTHDLTKQYARSFFHGSRQKLRQILADERNGAILLGDLANHYFTERLYLLRTISPIIGYFQDQSHPFQSVYSEALSSLPDLAQTLQSQLEKSFDHSLPTFSTRGQDCSPELQTRFALQRVKEQCEILEILLIYYSHFELPPNVLVKLIKLFKDHNFGIDHPLREVVDPRMMSPLLSCLSALEQIIIIEGLDMDFLMESEATKEHQLVKDKSAFKTIDDIIKEIVHQPNLSVLVLSWATVRYLVMDDHGGVTTQKLGERTIEEKVWEHFAHLLAVYPFNTTSNVSLTARRVLRGVLSSVTTSFHEDTLGDFSSIVTVATEVMNHSENSKGLSGPGLEQLLVSAAGYFPLAVEPLLLLVTSMTSSLPSAMEVHAFLSNLPSFAEFIKTCIKDDVESLEDASVWRLLYPKPLRTAGGSHVVKIPSSTIGHLVDSQFGEMVQWQHPVNGWAVFHAEIKSLLSYRGPSSNLDLIGFIQKSLLIYRLVEKILVSVQTDSPDTGCMAVLETMKLFVDHIPELLQKIIHTGEPPVELVATCMRCATAWINVDRTNHCEDTWKKLTRIGYFPYQNTPALHGQFQPGMFGSVLVEMERLQGTFPVTVATIELLTALLECSFKREGPTNTLSRLTEFIMTEIFCSFHDWQRNDVGSWEKIGLRCLEMCHLILGASTSVKSVSSLQSSIVRILSSASGSDVLLRMTCIDVDALHALIAAEPCSSLVHRVTEMVRLGFSVLNNVLRLDDLISNDASEPTQLHQVLAAPSAGQINVISIIAGYLYHRQTIVLPRLSVALLRRISLIAPMSIHGSLGADVAAVRDILLCRLQARAGDHLLKIGILELLVVSVQTQPGLLELFLDLELIDKTKPQNGYRLGKSSCLTVVTDMLASENQGTYKLPTNLHTACIKLANALWVGRRHTAIQALKNHSKSFWNNILLPLFSENSPKEIAQNELLETCAHALNIVALERFHTLREGMDPPLERAMEQFSEKKRFEHWSKVFLCVSKTYSKSKPDEQERHLMFVSAWKTFLLTKKIKDVVLLKNIIGDLMSSILFMSDETSSQTFLSLSTSLLLSLVSKQPSNFLSFLPRIVESMQRQFDASSKIDRSQVNLHSASVHLIKSMKEKASKDSCVSDFIQLSCDHLHVLMKDHDSWEQFSYEKKLFNVETSLLVIRALEFLFEDKNGINQSWLTAVSHESTIHMIMMILVKMITSQRDKEADLKCRLSTSILRLLTKISTHVETARMIKQTNILPELCLALSSAYVDNKKKWLEVYHLNIIMTSQLLECLSHDFVDDALDFIGVHSDRMCQSLSLIRVNQSMTLLSEVNHTTALLSLLSRDFTHEWKFKIRNSFECVVERVLVAVHSCTALLLHPRLLNVSIKATRKKQKLSASTPVKITKQTSLKSPEVDTNLPPDDVKEQMYSILGNLLSFLKNLSPDLSQLVMDLETCAEEFPQLVTMNFSTPTVDHEADVSFGTLLSATNMSLTALHKIEPVDTKLTFHASLTFVSEISLYLIISQCLLLLKLKDLPTRSKQILRRELSDELASCVKSARRHLRHSSSSQSPGKSPSGTPPKGILELVTAFVKHIMT